MNAKQLKLARQLLDLTQSDFANLLGWTSRRNVISIERGDKEMMKQTSLAVECLLRRHNKFVDFKKYANLKPQIED